MASAGTRRGSGRSSEDVVPTTYALPAAVDRDPGPAVVALAVEIRRVHERGPAGSILVDEGVGAELVDADDVAPLLLHDAGRRREVHGVRLARHVDVALPVEGDGVDRVVDRPAEVGRVDQVRAVGAQLRHEAGHAEGVAVRHGCNGLTVGKSPEPVVPATYDVARRVDRDVGRRVVPVAAEERRVHERAAVGAQLRDESVAEPLIRMSGQHSVRNAPGVVGKSAEEVVPVTYAWPCASTAIAVPADVSTQAAAEDERIEHGARAGRASRRARPGDDPPRQHRRAPGR